MDLEEFRELYDIFSANPLWVVLLILLLLVAGALGSFLKGVLHELGRASVKKACKKFRSLMLTMKEYFQQNKPVPHRVFLEAQGEIGEIKKQHMELQALLNTHNESINSGNGKQDEHNIYVLEQIKEIYEHMGKIQDSILWLHEHKEAKRLKAKEYTGLLSLIPDNK